MEKGHHYLIVFERHRHSHEELTTPMCHLCYERLAKEVPIDHLTEPPWFKCKWPESESMKNDELPVVGLYHSFSEYEDESSQYNCAVCHGKEKDRFFRQNGLIIDVRERLTIQVLYDRLVELKSVQYARDFLQALWDDKKAV